MSHDERKQRRRQIAEFIVGGATVAQACKMFGVTVRTVQTSCQAHGVTLCGGKAA
jgi:hypothetical protein